MNKKIIERLVDESTMYVARSNSTIFDASKFAELIVKECGAVALNIGCGDIEDELLKHFGVEE
jgi:hypothetical protein